MNKQEYENKLKQIQELLQNGRTMEAKKAIYGLRNIYPYSLKYICENVELMLKEGKDKDYCCTILDNICQEYYICDELIDIFHLKKELYPADTMEYKLCDFSEQLYTGIQKDNMYWQNLNSKKDAFLDSDIDGKKAMLKELAEAYYIVRNMNMYVALILAWCYCHGKISECESYIHKDAGQAFYGFYNVNLGYLVDLLRDEESFSFVLVEDVDSLNQDIDILADVLQFMGNRTIIIKQPKLGEIAENEHIAYSMQQAGMENGSIIIHPVIDNYNDKELYWLRVADIIQFLTESLEEKTALTVFAVENVMDALHEIKKYAKHLQRLSERRPEQFAYNMSFAWAGDYCKYMSYIYGFSVREKIEQRAECDVSIVIPVRNSADTLRYTLQTCLNQQTDAKYEIVLSDNSDEGNTKVYDLYRELADNRIKYYHTPFVLNLSKSFEFAFLHAKGKFITSIGADDGIYPWAVQLMKDFLPQMTDSNILRWNRSFYAWPHFSKEQENMLGFSLCDNTQHISLEKQVLKSQFDDVLHNLKKVLYALPSCYINSGFKREFFYELLTNTGRLWDGISQDLYISAVNLVNNEFIYYVDMPLTMAGMSGHSAGSLDGSKDACFDDLVRKINKYSRPLISQKGEYTSRNVEFLVPYINGIYADVIGFYRQIWHLQELGLVSTAKMNSLDMNDVFLDTLQRTSVLDTCFYARLYNVLYALEQKENEVYNETFNTETINFSLQEISERQANVKHQKVYATRYDRIHHTLGVDASDFAIANVQEAVNFVSKLMKLNNVPRNI